MTADEYALREFDPRRDTDAVIRCYESGFGTTYWPLFEYSDRPVLEDMVMTDYSVADVSLVAEAGGEARESSSGRCRTVRSTRPGRSSWSPLSCSVASYRGGAR